MIFIPLLLSSPRVLWCCYKTSNFKSNFNAVCHMQFYKLFSSVYPFTPAPPQHTHTKKLPHNMLKLVALSSVLHGEGKVMMMVIAESIFPFNNKKSGMNMSCVCVFISLPLLSPALTVCVKRLLQKLHVSVWWYWQHKKKSHNKTHITNITWTYTSIFQLQWQGY